MLSCRPSPLSADLLEELCAIAPQIVDGQLEVALVFVDVLQGIFGNFVHRTEILTQQEAAVVKVLHYEHHSKKKKKKNRNTVEKKGCKKKKSCWYHFDFLQNIQVGERS